MWGGARAREGRRTGHGRALVAVALLVAALLAGAVGPGVASTALAARARSAFRAHRVCGVPPADRAACLGVKLVPAWLTRADLRAKAARRVREAAAGARPAVTYKEPFPGYLTPESLHAAYSLPAETQSSSLQTIAVIDAFDDPTAEADLGVYDREFGLPECTTANGCFRKINQEGKTSPLPRKNGGWASEMSIDVQMAHAICQGCRVLLVEASSEEFSDLGAAVNAAVNAGATEISNSYGGAEQPRQASVFSEYNSRYYDHPGVVVTASSGDCGYLNETCPEEGRYAEFPADSPDVVAVGGTTLTDGDGTWSSTVWEEEEGGGGSGCSLIFAAPLWQSDVADFSATGCGEGRSVSDVAAIADPNSGVDVYDSTPEDDYPTGWGVWGGTSVSSPIVAAEFALAGGSHAVAYPAATLYSHLGEGGALYDVVSGSNGSCAAGDIECRAAVGYDGPSGVGSPIGLAAFSIAGAPASGARPTIAGVAEQGQTLTATAGEWTGSPTSTSEQWEDCNASGSGCAAIAGATGQTYTLTAGDVGATIRVQESASNAAGGGAPADSTQTATVTSDTPALASFTPTSGITGSTVTIEGTDLGGVGEVEFGALTASFKVLSATRIEATVPNGARQAEITLTAPGGSVTSRSKFKPTLSVTAFSPQSRAPGKPVTIKGVGFDSGSTVSFDGEPASVTYVSSKKLKATVPAGAQAGAIAVTNTSAPVGTVYSAGSFTP
jgi:hypothetical protein